MRLRAFFVLLALLLLAASPQPFAFGPWGEPDVRQQPVEQQTEGGALQPDESLWVVNNTQCAWDADDAWFTGGLNGYLAPGSTATVDRCVIADWIEHAVALGVNAESPNLIVQVSFSPQGYVFTASPRLEDGRYVYWICTNGPDYSHTSPDLQPIPNSGTAPHRYQQYFPGVVGGVGVVTTVTARVTNVGARTARKINALFRLRAEPPLADPERCPDVDNPDNPQFDHWREGTYPGPFISWETS
jgi:hypothetical protein